MFRNIYPRLGGLHTVVNFSSSVDKLIVDSGLRDILKHAFGSIDKMLSGKKFPQNVRVFSMLTEKRLHKHMSVVETLRSWMQCWQTYPGLWAKWFQTSLHQYGMFYLRSMASIPIEVESLFLEGQLTVRHVCGALNSAWSNMFIESTFIWYGRSQGELRWTTMHGLSACIPAANSSVIWQLCEMICLSTRPT